ncbi:MAG: riboflavin synthase [Chitinophagaceae bacterium]
MFTGIVEELGVITAIESHESNRDFWVECPFTSSLKIDQSLAHNGVCLTVVEILANKYRVTAVAETLSKTSLGTWKKGDIVNLERALRMGDRLDGHFVQGHVDAIGQCTSRENQDGSWLYTFQIPKSFATLVVEKGSICVDGVSLTAFNVGVNSFSVAIIPYTFEHTNFSQIVEGSTANLEFDILGKYFLRQQSLNDNNPNSIH